MLADAEWTNKALNQQSATINTCIACNQACLDHIFVGKLTPVWLIRLPVMSCN